MNVPNVMVKLVAALRADRRGATKPVSAVVLHVTESFVLNVESGCTKIVLLAVTAVVLTVHVPVEAFVAQEKEPVGAAEQVATDGFAAVPAPAQFVAVPIVPGSTNVLEMLITGVLVPVATLIWFVVPDTFVTVPGAAAPPIRFQAALRQL